MNIFLKINDFQPLDGDTANAQSTSQKRKGGEENPAKDSNSEQYRAVKKSHSAKAITKAKKLYRYSSLDGSFPSFDKNENDRSATVVWIRMLLHYGTWNPSILFYIS